MGVLKYSRGISKVEMLAVSAISTEDRDYRATSLLVKF